MFTPEVVFTRYRYEYGKVFWTHKLAGPTSFGFVAQFGASITVPLGGTSSLKTTLRVKFILNFWAFEEEGLCANDMSESRLRWTRLWKNYHSTENAILHDALDMDQLNQKKREKEQLEAEQKEKEKLNQEKKKKKRT